MITVIPVEAVDIKVAEYSFRAFFTFSANASPTCPSAHAQGFEKSKI